MALPPLPLRERRVFVDSSAYLALLDVDDEHHREAREIIQELAQARYRQFTTNVLLIESHALILSVLGRGRAAQFLKDMEESNTCIWVSQKHLYATLMFLRFHAVFSEASMKFGRNSTTERSVSF